VEPGTAAAEIIRFGIFELDAAAGELRRNGSIVRLPPQPFQVLRLLASNPGELLDRERIRREVWGETTVDFDRSLNVCITQIRTALNDDAESPRFIQTVPRRGYRFIGSVGRSAELRSPSPGPGRSRSRALLLLMAVAAALVGAATGYTLWHRGDPALRLAVLPFDHVGVATEDSAQAEGVFDELLTQLGGIQPDLLRVIGRRSVVRFAADRRSLRDIGQQLGVKYVIEGTIRREGDRLQAAVRLARTDNETLLWSGTFAQDGDAAAFEEQVVAQVSAAVLAKLYPDATPIRARDKGCRAGWEAYRTGRLLANGGTIAGLEKSVGFFEQAPCAASKAALAETFGRLARIGPRRPELWERARTAAREALKSDADIESAHLSLGNVAFWHDWNWKAAEDEFQTALRLNPSDPDAHHDLAWLLVARGRRQDAVASLNRAIALDPLSARISVDAGWLLLQAGRFRDAAAQARRTLELEPRMNEARACLSRALLYAGDDRGAYEAIRPLMSEEDMRQFAGLPAGEVVRRLFRNAIRAQGDMDPYQRAWRLAWVGARDDALAEIEQAFRVRSGMMPLVAVDPAFASIRKEARFQTVVRAMGL
jgi:DNA-binding winged helix-turn-helix (wHTH) protein